MYADYEFYQGSYYGDTIAPDAWDKYGTRASDFLDWMTRRQMVNNLPSNAEDLERIQKACCAVADAFYQIDKIKAAEASGGASVGVEGISGQIKSLSSGGESISFEASAVSRAVTGGETAINGYLYDVAKPYLSLVADDSGRYYLYWGL